MNVFIAGSSRGIGHALTLHLLEEGHEVWGLARTPQQARERFHACYGNACAFDREQLPERLDAVITCVGSQNPIGLAMECDPYEWIGGLRDNLFGVFNVIHAAYPRLFRRTEGRSRVICFSGGGAANPRPYLSSYACAKAAVVRLVETLAEEWKEFSIDINALAPGPIFTQMTQQILTLSVERTGHAEKEAARRVEAQNHAEAMRHVTECIDWLLSPAADGISGKLIAAKWDDWKTPEGLAKLREPGRCVLRRVL